MKLIAGIILCFGCIAAAPSSTSQPAEATAESRPLFWLHCCCKQQEATGNVEDTTEANASCDYDNFDLRTKATAKFNKMKKYIKIIGFACFKAKNLQEFDPENFNGFVFPPSICNRPDVTIRVSSVPFGTIKYLSYSTDEEKAVFEEIFKLPKETKIKAAMIIIPGGFPTWCWEAWIIRVCEALPNDISLNPCICVNQASKWIKSDLNEIGVILISGDAVRLLRCREVGEAVERQYEEQKNKILRKWGDRTQMMEIRVAGESKQSEEHLRCLKSHFQGFPLFTIKYPTAGIGYVHGRNLLRKCDAAGLLIGFVDETSATTVATI